MLGTSAALNVAVICVSRSRRSTTMMSVFVLAIVMIVVMVIVVSAAVGPAG